MKIGDICIVKETEYNKQHPAGSRVKILHILTEVPEDRRNVLAISDDGNTAYWYEVKDLEVIL